MNRDAAPAPPPPTVEITAEKVEPFLLKQP
jgi:hypothetical protein